MNDINTGDRTWWKDDGGVEYAATVTEVGPVVLEITVDYPTGDAFKDWRTEAWGRTCFVFANELRPLEVAE